MTRTYQLCSDITYIVHKTKQNNTIPRVDIVKAFFTFFVDMLQLTNFKIVDCFAVEGGKLNQET